MTAYTEAQIAKAIDAEAAAWARFFHVDNDADAIERRRRVMRANAAVGHWAPLLPYMEV